MVEAEVTEDEVQAFLAAYDHVFALLDELELRALVERGERVKDSYADWFAALAPELQATIERRSPTHRGVARALDEAPLSRSLRHREASAEAARGRLQ